MDFRQWFAIHFPSQHDFMDLDLPLRYRNHVIIDLTFLEVCINTHELNMLSPSFQTTTVLDDLFQADARPSRCPNCTFTPL